MKLATKDLSGAANCSGASMARCPSVVKGVMSCSKLSVSRLLCRGCGRQKAIGQNTRSFKMNMGSSLCQGKLISEAQQKKIIKSRFFWALTILPQISVQSECLCWRTWHGCNGWHIWPGEENPSLLCAAVLVKGLQGAKGGQIGRSEWHHPTLWMTVQQNRNQISIKSDRASQKSRNEKQSSVNISMFETFKLMEQIKQRHS